jgi:hypothetical protein
MSAMSGFPNTGLRAKRPRSKLGEITFKPFRLL